MTQVGILDRKPHAASQPTILGLLERFEKRGVLTAVEVGVVALFVLVIAIDAHKTQKERVAASSPARTPVPVARAPSESDPVPATREAAVRPRPGMPDLARSFRPVLPPSLMPAYRDNLADQDKTASPAPAPVVARTNTPAPALATPPAAKPAGPAKPAEMAALNPASPPVAAPTTGPVAAAIPPRLTLAKAAEIPVLPFGPMAPPTVKPATGAGSAVPRSSPDLSQSFRPILPPSLAPAYKDAGSGSTPAPAVARAVGAAPKITPPPAEAAKPPGAETPTKLATLAPAPTSMPSAALAIKPPEQTTPVKAAPPSAAPPSAAPPSAAPAEPKSAGGASPAGPIKEARLHPEDQEKALLPNQVREQKDFAEAFLSASRMLERRLTPEERSASMPPDFVDAIQRVEGFYDPTRVGPFGTGLRMQIRPGTMSMTDVFGERWTRAYPDPNVHYRVGYHAESWLRPRSHKCEDFWRFRPTYSPVALDKLTPNDCARIRGKSEGDNQLVAESSVVAAPLTVPVFAAPYPGSRMTHDELMAALRERADAAREQLWYGRAQGAIRRPVAQKRSEQKPAAQKSVEQKPVTTRAPGPTATPAPAPAD